MKKLFSFLAIATLVASQSFASPVNVGRAQQAGLKFMQSNAERQASVMNHVYTQHTNAGTPALYVFNTENGFVVVSADDVAQPILAFGEDGGFDVNNIPDGVDFFLRYYAAQIDYAIGHGMTADAETVAQWEHVMRDGFVNDNRGTADVAPLLTSTWNQDCYYNMLCPTSSNWMAPCGHVYAGCVATAMSMLMHYWRWPDQGTGTHSYTPSGFPLQSVDFENTHYDWDNMVNNLTASSSNAQKQAVAQLMWHCGVSVDMQYNYSASGAMSEDVVPAIINYFRYTNKAEIKSKDNFTKAEWEDMLMLSLDQGVPLYYAGSDEESGHAFACVGYRSSDRKFRFNWGWSGASNNTYFAIDALNNVSGYNLNMYQRAIFDYIPDYVYDNMIPAAADLSVTSENAHSKVGVVSWTNPTVSMSGAALQNIEKVVLLRNGVEIFSQENVQPGQAMSFDDHVDQYDSYQYRLYYLTDGVKGRIADTKYQYGPTCTWKVICQTTNFQGWNKGKLQVLNGFGSLVDEITMTNSTPMSQLINLPEGAYSFKWVGPYTEVTNLSINIKNSDNTSVYNFSGSSNSLSGVIHSGENDCTGCLPPTNLAAQYQWTGDAFGTLLTWEYDSEPKSFKIYRSANGTDYVEIGEANKTVREYFDPVDAGTYYYKVTAFRNHCESTPAWANDDTDFVQVAVTSVDECDFVGGIYPNPANASLRVEAEDLRQVVIANMMGQVVFSQTCSEGNGMVVGTSSFAPGLYVITIRTATANVTRHFSVVH